MVYMYGSGDIVWTLGHLSSSQVEIMLLCIHLGCVAKRDADNLIS